MRKKARRTNEETREQWLADFERTQTVMLVAIIKETSKPGDEGHMVCPVCHDGTLVWSRAKSNGHVAIQCTRTFTDESGEEKRCVAAIE